MALYDNNGTTNAEIGTLYDNNGTTNYQIGSVYDHNGTTNSLIYTAESVLLPSSSVLNKSTSDSGMGGTDLDSISTSALVAGGYLGSSHNTNSHYKVVYITTALDKSCGALYYILSKTAGSRTCGGCKVGVWNGSTFTEISSGANISNISGTLYFAMKIYSETNSYANNEANKWSCSNISVK